MKIFGASLLLATLLQTPATFAAGSACSVVFGQLVESHEVVDRVIHDLANLRLSLDIAKAQGLNAPALTAMTAEYSKKEQTLMQKFESQGIMSRAEMLQKIERQISQIQSRSFAKKEQQDKNKEEERQSRKALEQRMRTSVISGHSAVFSRIEAGSFVMTNNGNVPLITANVTLTKDFDFMATVTTQIIWKKVAQLANTKLQGKYQISEDPSHFKGDTRPVENITVVETQTWFKALNELSQLGEPALLDFIDGHKQGDIYRLPTDAEWEFVVRGRGPLNGKYSFGDDYAKLKDHAWYENNSGRETHPVAEKLPLKFDNVEVYDMHGNVWEFTLDSYTSRPPGGTDPLISENPRSGQPASVVMRGGSMEYNAYALISGSRGEVKVDFAKYNAGFRMVREVGSKEVR